MRYKLLCLVLLLEMLVVSAPILRATDLRGGVVGFAGPRAGVGVALFEVKPNKTFRLVRQTVTAPDGKYYLNNVHPGQCIPTRTAWDFKRASVLEDDDPALVRLACGLYLGIITDQKGRAR